MYSGQFQSGKIDLGMRAERDEIGGEPIHHDPVVIVPAQDLDQQINIFIYQLL
jgi:hypothetical protein